MLASSQKNKYTICYSKRKSGAMFNCNRNTPINVKLQYSITIGLIHPYFKTKIKSTSPVDIYLLFYS